MALLKLTQVNKVVTAAGTRVALASAPTLVRSFMIQANNSNTGSIYVGDSTVSSAVFGTQLLAGNTITVEAPDMGPGGANDLDLSEIYVDSSINGDGISVIILKRN